MYNNKGIQYMVHNFRCETIDFRGSEDECIKYIIEHDSKEFPLELYWQYPGDKYYKTPNKLEEDERELF